MKIPKYIENAIIRAGKTTAIHRNNSEIVRSWLQDKGLVNEDNENLTNESVADMLIDCIENGFDGSGALIDYLKKL